MRFFEKQRPEVYIHGAKLRRDKKSGKRLWGMTFIVTLTVDLVESCDVSVAKAWQYITERDSGAAEVLLISTVMGCGIDCFSQIDEAVPALHLEGVDLAGLRLTRDGNVVEFWFAGEHENTAGLHSFMKEYAFTRCWMQFSSQQGDLKMDAAQEKLADDPAFLGAVDRLASAVRSGGIDSLTISTPGMEPVVIDKAAAERIRKRAEKAEKS
jgi:hypothetical protein